MSKLIPKIENLHRELAALIAASRQRAAVGVNAELSMLYWSVGKRLNKEILGGKRAAYGAGIVDQIGVRLSGEFGRGFEAKNLRRMITFAQLFPDLQIVATLSRQLGWSHVKEILPLEDEQQRLYYALTAGEERWSVRELRRRIETKTWERTALATLRRGQDPTLALTGRTGKSDLPDPLAPALVFKDPYFLEFLGLPPGYDERDLETAILGELERFILELGSGFAFVERQKRIILDGEDFYLDLLFFHRRLKRLVAVDLKLGRFKAAHKGQMELYLRWLDRYERQPGEEAPIGLILCASAAHEQVELLEMHRDGIMVAEYWTDLPPKAELERRLHRALIEARERLAVRRLPAPAEKDDPEGDV
jgi:predicted nuclease of restriction endonuclease-like (RecB) superfamily